MAKLPNISLIMLLRVRLLIYKTENKNDCISLLKGPGS